MQKYTWSDEELEEYYTNLPFMERVFSLRSAALWRLDDAVQRVDLFLAASTSKSRVFTDLKEKFRGLVWRECDHGFLLSALRIQDSHPYRDNFIRREVIPTLQSALKLMPEKVPFLIKDEKKRLETQANYEKLLLEWRESMEKVVEDLEADPDDEFTLRDEKIHTRLKNQM